VDEQKRVREPFIAKNISGVGSLFTISWAPEKTGTFVEERVAAAMNASFALGALSQPDPLVLA